MAGNSDNRKRAFAEVVTIDAWHGGFGPDVAAVDLHVDVVFGTARVGGEVDAPVRFRLSVKQADVVIVIPPTEPVKVDRNSVSRDSPELEGRVVDTIERSAKGKIKGQVTGSISPTGITGSATTNLEAEAGISATNKVEVSATIQFFVVTQSKTVEGDYRWSLRPTTGGILEGRPWDAKKQSRVKLIDERKDRSKGIPPTVRVEVRCRREDLHITDLEIKDETAWEAVKHRTGFKKREAAAEAYIRDQLIKEGLEVRNIMDAFGQLTLASTIAET